MGLVLVWPGVRGGVGGSFGGWPCDRACTARCVVGWLDGQARQAILKRGGGVYRLDRVHELLGEMAAGQATPKVHLGRCVGRRFALAAAHPAVPRRPTLPMRGMSITNLGCSGSSSLVVSFTTCAGGGRRGGLLKRQQPAQRQVGCLQSSPSLPSCCLASLLQRQPQGMASCCHFIRAA